MQWSIVYVYNDPFPANLLRLRTLTPICGRSYRTRGARNDVAAMLYP